MPQDVIPEELIESIKEQRRQKSVSIEQEDELSEELVKSILDARKTPLQKTAEFISPYLEKAAIATAQAPYTVPLEFLSKTEELLEKKSKVIEEIAEERSRQGYIYPSAIARLLNWATPSNIPEVIAETATPFVLPLASKLLLKGAQPILKKLPPKFIEMMTKQRKLFPEPDIELPYSRPLAPEPAIGNYDPEALQIEKEYEIKKSMLELPELEKAGLLEYKPMERLPRGMERWQWQKAQTKLWGSELSRTPSVDSILNPSKHGNQLSYVTEDYVVNYEFLKNRFLNTDEWVQYAKEIGLRRHPATPEQFEILWQKYARDKNLTPISTAERIAPELRRKKETIELPPYTSEKEISAEIKEVSGIMSETMDRLRLLKKPEGEKRVIILPETKEQMAFYSENEMKNIYDKLNSIVALEKEPSFIEKFTEKPGKALKEFGISLRVPTRYYIHEFPKIRGGKIVPGIKEKINLAEPFDDAYQSMSNARLNLFSKSKQWKEIIPNVTQRRLVGIVGDNYDAQNVIDKSVEFKTKGEDPNKAIDYILEGTELTKFFTPEMKKALREYVFTIRGLAYSGGLKAEKFQRAYLPRIIEYLKEGGMMEDAKEIEKIINTEIDIEKTFGYLKNKIKSEVWTGFFLERHGGRKYYDTDFTKIFDLYVFPVTRKAFLEPELKYVSPYINILEKENPDMAKAFVYHVNSIMGRNPNPALNVDNFAKGLVGVIYKGTLYGNSTAGLTNLTQIINTASKIGPEWTAIGMQQFATKEGRELFKHSGVLYIPIQSGAKFRIKLLEEPLDFMSMAEYILRGTTYLGERAKQLHLRKPEMSAHELAKKTVRETQFSISVADMPRIVREHPLLLQYKAFDIKNIEFIVANIKDPKFFARYMLFSYLLGGPKIIPYWNKIKKAVPEEYKKYIENAEKYSNFSGLSQQALNFFFPDMKFPEPALYKKTFLQGIGESFKNPLSPFVSSLVKAASIPVAYYEGERDLGEYGKKFLSAAAPFTSGYALSPFGIIPKWAKFIPGGTTLKKGYEVIKGIKEGEISGTRGLIRKTTPGEQIMRFFAQPESQAEYYEKISEVSLKKKRMENERKMILDLKISAKEKFNEGNEEEGMALMREASKRLKDWNSEPENVDIKISLISVKRREESKKKTGLERLIGSFPKRERKELFRRYGTGR